MSRKNLVNRRISVSQKLAAAASLAMLGIHALPAAAQVVTWTGGNGNWSDSLKWTAGVPNSATATAMTDSNNPTVSLVTVNGSFTVGTLLLSAGDEVSIAPSQTLNIGTFADIAGTLRIGNGANLTMAGTANNNGRIVFSPNGSENFLNIGGGPLTINGTGTIQFDWTGTGSAGVISAQSSGTLTLGANQVVQGVGSFRNSRVINNGLIDANSGTAGLLGAGMYIDPSNQSASPFINNGTIRSSNGGLMVFAGDNGGELVNNGTISAIGNNSITELHSNVTILGGTYATTGTGVVRVRPGQTGNASNFTITPGSQFQVPNNARLNLSGTITNNGSLNVISGASHAFIGLPSAVTLQGTGVTRLASNPAVSNATIDGQGTLTITAGHTLAGGGHLDNVRVINNGTIRADQTGTISMYLDPSNQITDSFVNNATIQASTGAVVSLAGESGGNFVGSGVYRADGAGARVDLINGISISGGSYTTTAGGVVHVPSAHVGNVTAPTITAGSEFRVEDNGRLNVSGTVNNNSTLSINAGTSNAFLGVPVATTLQGPGITRFNSTLTADASLDGQGTVTIAAGHVVRGDGYLNNVRVINNGSIIGDDSVARLGGTYLDPSNQIAIPFINNGTIGVVANNFVSLVGDSGGAFSGNGVYRADGSNAFLHLANNVTVVGGNYTTTAGGVVRVPTAHTGNVDAPTITAGTVFNVDNNARLNIKGIVTNNGSLTITSGASHSFLSVSSGGSATLTGSGVTRFVPNPGVTNASVDGQGTLTIAAGHLVAGSAYFDNTRVINNGTIRGDLVTSATTMYLDPYNGNANAIVNNATIQAVTGATVSLAGDSGGNFAGNGVYRADGVGAVVQLINGVEVVGGNFTTTANGEIRVPSAHNAILNGSTITPGTNFAVP
ncbi:MAG: hypothetical protein H7Z14_09840, partial [Anaerolineae bacterium]|nr:hypothetical protein [Phycisphaerae bacterium]